MQTLIEILAVSNYTKDKRTKIIKKILRHLNVFMKYQDNNQKYIVIVILEMLIEYQEDLVLPQLSEVEQSFVFSCLQCDDSSICRKSYGLLHALATSDNIKEVGEKMILHLKEIDDDFYKSELITRIVKLIERFNETSLDWRTFVLLRLLQASKETKLKKSVMGNIQSLLDKSPRTDESQEVGIKLRNLLEAPAKAPGAPDTLLELYLWTVAKFSDNNIDACQKVSEIIKNSNNNEHILICALHHLFDISTAALNGHEIPKEHIKQIIKDTLKEHESLLVQDLIKELSFILGLSEKINDLSILNENTIDCTLTFLDEFVVEQLENGAPIYDPDKILVPILPESKSPALRFTPYNVMSESEWKTISTFSQKSESNLSSDSFKAATPEVWTLKGRIKEDEKRLKTSTSFSDDSKENAKLVDFEESVIQDVNQWK